MLGSSFKFSHEVSRMLQISGRIISFGLPQSWVILGGDWASPSKFKTTDSDHDLFLHHTPQKIKWLRIPSFIAVETPKIQWFHTLFDLCQVYFCTSDQTGGFALVFVDKNCSLKLMTFRSNFKAQGAEARL